MTQGVKGGLRGGGIEQRGSEEGRERRECLSLTTRVKGDCKACLVSLFVVIVAVLAWLLDCCYSYLCC